MAGKHLLERMRKLVERRRGGIDVDLAALHAQQHEGQRLSEPAQARICREDLNQRLGLIELAADALHISRGQEQQAVAQEKIAVLEIPHTAEHIRLRGQASCQGDGGLSREFRRRRVKDRNDRFLPLWKRCIERNLSLPPWQVRSDQFFDIRVDCKCPFTIDAGNYRQKQCDTQNCPRAAGANIDNGLDRLVEHGGCSSYCKAGVGPIMEVLHNVRWE